MIDSDLPCFGLPFTRIPSSSFSLSSRVEASGKGEVSRDREGLCPPLSSGRTGGPIDECLDIEGRGEWASGIIFRCLSPTAYPLDGRCREGDRSLLCCRAAFLKVITQLTSSPAYTVPWLNWTDMRMLVAGFVDMTDSVAATREVVGGDRGVRRSSMWESVSCDSGHHQHRKLEQQLGRRWDVGATLLAS